MIERDFELTLAQRLAEPSPRIQVIMGPRQVGKTTGVKRVLSKLGRAAHYASADELLTPAASWLRDQWARAEGVLVIDEIQKVTQWSETIKALWDAQESKNRLRVVLLGSSSLRLQAGLSESLAGRYELIRAHHWGSDEWRRCFGGSLEEYLAFGGYPGAAEYQGEYPRWHAYVKDSILEAVLMRDILGLQTVRNPALFRQCFEIACSYPAQEISYTKLLGQLQQGGNTDLVKHYLELFEGAYLLKTLQKYSMKKVKTKSSSPKILPLCPALVTMALGPHGVKAPEIRGRLLEMAVGCDLSRLPGELYYWREKGNEVDYVYSFAGEVFAIEVKSGRRKSERGLHAFATQYPKAMARVVDERAYPAFAADPAGFLRD